MTFRILESQMTALGRNTRARFVGMMASYLSEDFPEWLEGRAASERTQWLSSAVDKAVRCDIDTEPETAQFVLLLTALGLDADEKLPWLQAVLEDRTLVGIGKVRKIIAECEANDIDVEDVLVYDEMRPAP